MTEIFEASCPYCGEQVDVIIDTTAGDQQEYVEDCPVCCRPWQVRVEQDIQGGWRAVLLTADE